MTKILVQHDISQQIVEIEEVHLAHPVLGPHYKRVRVDENGKVYVLKPTLDEENVPADKSDTEKGEK